MKKSNKWDTVEHIVNRRGDINLIEQVDCHSYHVAVDGINRAVHSIWVVIASDLEERSNNE